MTDWRSVTLLGIDVGFSATRASTGIAQYCHGEPVRLDCVRTGAGNRAAALIAHRRFDAIAIDGPIVFDGAPLVPRACEQILARKPFGRVCMAGYSHFGTGLTLREHAIRIAQEMRPRLRKPNAPIVEAFPNAFLGVLLSQDAIDALRPIARGEKSDLFYRCAVECGAFTRLLDHLQWDDATLRDDISALADDRSRAAHEHRAAMVCVLTAGCALSRQAESVGDDAGGFICLPPRAVWADWSRAALSDLEQTPHRR